MICASILPHFARHGPRHRTVKERSQTEQPLLRSSVLCQSGVAVSFKGLNLQACRVDYNPQSGDHLCGVLFSERIFENEQEMSMPDVL